MSIAGLPISANPISSLGSSYAVAYLSASASLSAIGSLDGYETTGGIVVGGEAEFRIVADFSQPIEWQVRTYFDAVKEFEWDVGEVPLKVYQVEGVCRPNSDNCDVLPLDTNDPLDCSQRFLQTIFAPNLAGVCDFLTKTNWKWPIASIKKFSTPAAQLIADGTNIPPECNALNEVEFCQIPECFEFCLHTDQISHTGVFTEVIDNIVRYVGSGGIEISGKARLWNTDVSGGIVMSGSADAITSYYAASGSGGIVISGESTCKSSYFATQGVGGIVVAGESGVVSPIWHYSGSGDIAISGAADTIARIIYSASGLSNVYPVYAGINISGRADYPILVTPTGGITLGGSAISAIIDYSYIGTGGINIGGVAHIVSPSWHYSGSGGINMAGNSNYTSNAWAYAGTGGINVGGDASYRNSILGDFWYTAITTSPITLSGEAADCRVSQLKYKGDVSSPIILGGAADITSSFVPTAMSSMGMGFGIEDLEMNFSLDGAQVAAIVPPSNVINTSCGECNALSMQLNFKHNIEFGNVFREFLIRNGLEVPETFSLFYSKRLDLWQGTLHYNGYAADNLSNTENWKINVDWGCTKNYAGDSFASSVWKFSLLMTRRNIDTGIDFDTRLVILFPSEDICLSADRDGLDFSFQYDTKKNYVYTRENLVVDMITLYDNIGLFKSKYWLTNRFKVRISEDLFQDALNKTDISFILPTKQPQFAI